MNTPEPSEMLTLAAKAAGFHLLGWNDDREGYHCNDVSMADDGYWNPLADDGDALRLAVRLQIEVSPRKETAAAYRWDVGCNINGKTYSMEHYCDSDPSAATRRAIVRAAAEIGKAMK
jgi:hypothetical protein